MPRASNAAGASNAVDASNPRVAWTVAVAALAILAGRELHDEGRRAPSIPKIEARAAALVEAEVGRLWAASSQASNDADAQLKLLTKELVDVEKLASSIWWEEQKTTRKPSRRPSRPRRRPQTRIVTTPGPRRVDWPRPRGRTPTRRRPVRGFAKGRPAGGVCSCCREAPRRNFS